MVLDDVAGYDRIESAQLVLQKHFEGTGCPNPVHLLNSRQYVAGKRAVFGQQSLPIGVIDDRRQPSVALRSNGIKTGADFEDPRDPGSSPLNNVSFLLIGSARPVSGAQSSRSAPTEF